MNGRKLVDSYSQVFLPYTSPDQSSITNVNNDTSSETQICVGGNYLIDLQ